LSSKFGLRTSFGFRHSAFGFFPRVASITHRKDAVHPATNEIAIGSELGIDATKKLPGDDFKRP
jgi:hypothetical protein